MVEDPIATGTRGYLRMRVNINTNMPLPIGFRLPHKDGSKSLIRPRYEGLKRLCFRCGRLGHVNRPDNQCIRPLFPVMVREGLSYGTSLATDYIKGPTPLFPAKPMTKATSSTVCADEPHGTRWSEREEGSMYGVHPQERVESEGEDREVESSRPLHINQVSFQRFEQNNVPPEALKLTSNSNTLHKAT
ncbi:hypothetical protein D8674_010270 [Pyrus ussuriensis x Pyrus communis]|uniref:Zinc knuckle CX2CX4HX4C domain-containing protein n=1 Tax=Pyrus ussuriensis x Pyrus communis TaxID=2448454 RepID=A0A5N5FA95_9ROSA|nr:hypothetical protein D8674_010270 [Pyrus ussuriensis x Pyrus communis]